MASQQVLGVLILFVCLVNGVPTTRKFKTSLDTLELVHVVFRHGDRTQDGTYPTDPYASDKFYPVGAGQLTTAGKTREYNIGAFLRATYGDFLGDVYFPGILRANSSSLPRCKASLELLLAALFPPSDVQRWSSSLSWQPIPYDYLPVSEDLLFWSTSACSKYKQYFEEHVNSKAYQKTYEPYADVLAYLQEKSGIKSRALLGGMLFSTLRSQQEWGLVLPEWSKSVWPEPIKTITQLDWKQLFATEETRALGAGFLMSKILNDTQLTINGDSSVEDTRIYLYSGHDTNIVALLFWLGITDVQIPQYGSFMVIEVHNILSIRFLRIIHENYQFDTPQVINIPGCGFYCPFDTFVNLYSKYINPYELCN